MRVVRAVALVAAFVGVAAGAADAQARQLPPGFVYKVLYDGLKDPTAVAVAPNGTVFVAEKQGRVLSFHGRDDRKPTIVANLRREVHSFDERGMTGIEVDPGYPKRPYIYVSYTLNAPLGLPAPFWGLNVKSGKGGEGCLGGIPDLAYKRGCVVSSRVSRLPIGRKGKAGPEEVLLNDWCQQFGSHSIGELAFDRAGALLIGAGEGANFNAPDTGSRGNPVGVCADPPGEGGALRSQDLRTPGDPVTLDGTIARINPVDGSPAYGNPNPAPGNEGRIVAYGLRNPFRFALRPGTDEIWIADVGWVSNEEIDVVTLGGVKDFGWPCFEGNARQPRYTKLKAPICTSLNPKTDVSDPFFTYRHGGPVVPGDGCNETDAAAISGIEFDRGSHFPFPFDDGLFFADYLRGCIWSMGPGRFGRPDRRALDVFESEAATPIDLTAGPSGLLYVDILDGRIHEISYRGPTAELRVRTRPKGTRVKIGKRTELGGKSVTVRRGASMRVSVPNVVRGPKRVLEFRRWSDGGSRSHRVVVTANTTVTASYRCRKHCGRKADGPGGD